MPYRSSHDIRVKDVMALNTKNAKGWAHKAMVIQRDSALKLALVPNCINERMMLWGVFGGRLVSSTRTDGHGGCERPQSHQCDGAVVQAWGSWPRLAWGC